MEKHCYTCAHMNKSIHDHPCCVCIDKNKFVPQENDIEEKSCSEAVNHPKHYQGKNECIDVMLAMFGKEAVKHFCMCNAYKYRYRADRKNGHEDIEKAEWYETKLMELGGCDD